MYAVDREKKHDAPVQVESVNLFTGDCKHLLSYSGTRCSLSGIVSVIIHASSNASCAFIKQNTAPAPASTTAEKTERNATRNKMKRAKPKLASSSQTQLLVQLCERIKTAKRMRNKIIWTENNAHDEDP